MRALPLLLCALALALGCSKEPVGHVPEPKPPIVEPFHFSVPAGLTRLRFGLVPHLSKDSLRATRAPLASYLSSQLQLPVELVVGDSYDDVAAKLARGELDLVELSPFAYVRARSQAKLVPLVSAIAAGSASSGSYIVVREDSPYHSVEDLKGTTFGFVDPASASGYLYPMKLFKDRGIRPHEFFGSTVFLGNHEAVLLAVLHGEAEAGATWQGSLLALKQSQGVDPISFRVIAKTPRTPQDIYCARDGLPPEVGQAVSQLLRNLSMHRRDDRQVLTPMNANGFVAVDEGSYDAVARVAAEVDAGW